MKSKVLLLQRAAFVLSVGISVLLFVLAISFATPFYPIKLYGGEAALSMFEGELQDFNRLYFYSSLALLLCMAFYWISGVRKYFFGKILFPLCTALSAASVGVLIYTLAALADLRAAFYDFDYAADLYANPAIYGFSVSEAFYILHFAVLGVAIAGILLFEGAAACGFHTYLRKRG